MMTNTPATPLNDAHQAGFFMQQTPFQKPALSIADQITLLESRGMVIGDHEQAAHYLRFIGYYRLSGYWLPFQHRDGSARHDLFKPETCFERILDIYVFDRQIRLLAMDALERIEIAARSVISNTMSERFGPHWFADADNFTQRFNHQDFQDRILSDTGIDPSNPQKRARSIEHYQQNYTSPKEPPSWMTFEFLSFGTVSIVFQNLNREDKTAISTQFGLSRGRLGSWLHAMSHIRNLCAHHSRVWNRKFGIRPFIAKSEAHHVLEPDKFYNHAVVMQTLMKRISGDTHWADRLGEILDRHPRIPLDEMGFPPNWQDEKIWQ